ncbi:hypothetical protein PRUPE_4G125100 [Prunus persica]|uniref:Uncharacterized protein n=1 Tax=Prunus persica TaxID=3760 RepID=A0A251PJM0_PRUPE|nr:hypothetical protein PRUPE_4G125100 [Prunus persica]
MGIPEISPKLNPHSKPKKYTQNKKNKFLTTPQVAYNSTSFLYILGVLLNNINTIHAIPSNEAQNSPTLLSWHGVAFILCELWSNSVARPSELFFTTIKFLYINKLQVNDTFFSSQPNIEPENTQL